MQRERAGLDIHRFSQSWRVRFFTSLSISSFPSFFATAATQTGDSGEAKLKALQESLIEKVKEFQLTVDICYFYFGIVSDVDIAAADSETPSGCAKYFVC